MQRSQARAGSESAVYYFYCNRSGFYAPRGKSIRSLKSQRTSKVNCYCSSYIKAKCMSCGTVKAEYCSTHHNHQPDIAHLTLPRRVKMLIATKIQQGVSVDRILDDVRDTIAYGDERHTQHQKTIKCAQRLETQCRFYKHRYLQLIIKENEKHNPILYYKSQDEIDATGLLEKDILFCIQRVSVRHAEKFGSKAICMDATHRTNQ